MNCHDHDKGCAEGKARRDEKFSIHEARRALVLDRARIALVDAAIINGFATADDVHDRLGPLPPGIDGRCLGPAGSLLAKAGVLKPDGFVKSRRPERHASILQKWVIADLDAAIRWKKSHPLPTDDEPPANEATLNRRSTGDEATLNRRLTGEQPTAGRTGLPLFDF